jgi:enterochelin esterase-like enzyme
VSGRYGLLASARSVTVGAVSPGIQVHAPPAVPSSVTDRLSRPGPLENAWTVVAVLAIAAAVIGWWVVLAVRRRRLGRSDRVWLRRTAFGVATAVLLSTGMLLAINAYAGYVPTVGALGDLLTGRAAGAVSRSADDDPTGGPGGSTLVRATLGDPGDGVPDVPVYVYLPPRYDDPANRSVRYPVIYLLHGYPGVASDWPRAARAQQAADLLVTQHLMRPVIQVFPTVSGSWGMDSECLDAVHGARVETYLTKTLVSWVDRHFRTIRGRTGRAVGGMSSGGYCALNLGLRHQNTFSVIMASEPYGDPGRRAEHALLADDPALVRANSPSWYARTIPMPRPMAVFLDAGRDDPGTASTARQLARLFAARGQYVALRETPGLGHGWREARAELPYALVFAARHLAPAGPAAGRHPPPVPRTGPPSYQPLGPFLPERRLGISAGP